MSDTSKEYQKKHLIISRAASKASFVLMREKLCTCTSHSLMSPERRNQQQETLTWSSAPELLNLQLQPHIRRQVGQPEFNDTQHGQGATTLKTQPFRSIQGNIRSLTEKVYFTTTGQTCTK
jgi:hypothetical protein